MFRIGAATLHTPELRGFHAPGITGPFGSAAACAALMRLPAGDAAHAFGIAGSLAGGLLAFAKSGSGGMVKRLHLGRAAESGVLAARLAAKGYEAPRNALEGRYGVLDAFGERSDPALLTADLGETFEIERLCIKRYPCHVTAHAPVELLRRLMAASGFAGDDIADMTIEVSSKVMSHHSDPSPADIMLAQYSVPFSVAIAAYHDPADPRVFGDAVIHDPRVRALAQRLRIATSPDQAKGWGVTMRVALKSGTVIEDSLDAFAGCPERPFTAVELRTKFDRLAADEADRPRQLFDALMRIDEVGALAELPLA
jgi:2-methylcitrate dehydratase PrpD